MKTPDIPRNENKRQASLCSLNILDTPAENRFDGITRRAQKHFNVPITLVSLIDADRQWFKSSQGLDAPETPRDVSFCGHAILSNDIFYVPDSHEDPRFADNPLVTGPPHVRFYAGAPLHAPDGQRIGTLCLIDHKPREFTPEELSVLREMADEVEKELVKRSSRIKLTIVQKLSLSAVVLVLISSGLVGSLFYTKMTSLLVEQSVKNMALEVHDAVTRVKILIDTQRDDALLLARTPPIQGILRAKKSADNYDQEETSSYSQWVNRLQSIFIGELESKSSYLTIRFIDKDGQELVVAGRDDEKIVTFNNEKLQNKAHRNYVKETLTLPAGSTYLSDINLNREHGTVSKPHQEVLRSATPVYDETSDEVAGLLLITAGIGHELLEIQKIIHDLGREIYITNDQGDYLLHPDTSKTYGFDLGKRYHIAENFPGLAKFFLPANKDTNLILQPEDTGGKNVANFTKIAFDRTHPERFLTVGVTELYDNIVARQSSVLNEVLFVALLLAVAVMLLAIVLAYRFSKPIKQITQVMVDYVRQQETTAVMPVNQNDEIGVLARSYEALIGQVKEAQVDLEEMNSKLEVMVKERTQALKMSEVRQRAILENIIDGLITIDGKGIIASFNPAASRIFGYSVTEVMDCNIKMLMPEPYTSEHDNYLHNYLTTGEKKVIGIGREVVGQRKDGSTFPMELSVSEMEIYGERMFTGIVRDITERKQAEQAFQEMNAIRQGILDSADFTIVTTDIEGLIETFNKGAERSLGYTEDEMVGKQSPAILHVLDEVVARAAVLSKELGRNIEPGFEVFVAKARMGEVDENEWTYVRKDGSHYPVLLSVTAIRDNDNEIKGFLGIGLDITERKKVESMKSEFISTVSHELRTPLTSIRGALGLVLGKAADKLPAKMLTMLQMANRNSERLTLLINDILDLEKIESGRLEFEFKTSDLVELARQALADNEGYATQHNVNLLLDTSLEQAPVQGDAHRLLQVFANLISNAVKYSHENGTVEISVTAHETNYRVGVQDHGSGIPEEFHSTIFQRFAQADSSDTREKGGTGLGLSISKAIIERHDGNINYKSELGKGTAFYFDIPIAQQSTRENNESINDAKVKVLVCEDNPDVAEILAEMLQTENMDSDIAATAEAARSLITKNKYSLMLLDLNLPDMDGLQFLQELRTKPASMKLPIIIVSGRATEGQAKFTGDAVMVVDWIQKPVDREQLERAMAEALRRKVRPRILHVEDDPDIVQVTQVLLNEIADVTHEVTVKGARARLSKEDFDLVILDLGLADGSGVELLDELKGRCPVVIFSAQNPGRDISAQVTAALTKSMTSNEQLLATIRDVLQEERK